VSNRRLPFHGECIEDLRIAIREETARRDCEDRKEVSADIAVAEERSFGLRVRGKRPVGGSRWVAFVSGACGYYRRVSFAEARGLLGWGVSVT
jgi:hypothetical protein